MEQWYVYILESLKDGQVYVGMSTNPQKRLEQHNAGKTRSTKSRRPFKIIYEEICRTREEARKREVFLKSYSGSQEKRRIIDRAKKIWGVAKR